MLLDLPVLAIIWHRFKAQKLYYWLHDCSNLSLQTKKCITLENQRSGILLYDWLAANDLSTQSESWHVHLVYISRVCTDENVCAIFGCTECCDLLQFATTKSWPNIYNFCIGAHIKHLWNLTNDKLTIEQYSTNTVKNTLYTTFLHLKQIGNLTPLTNLLTITNRTIFLDSFLVSVHTIFNKMHYSGILLLVLLLFKSYMK